ncbi:ATP-binding protein [Candidatus Woesearchaeota archaeon]|nr:ATP-binding protein [Candidatus Woesearchaeota archaeon]
MNIQQAQQLEQQAKTIPDKQKSRALYLDAAELYLQLSKNDKKNEKLFVQKATELYLKAQEIPIIEQTQSSAAKKPKLSFKDVGGLEKLKEAITSKIIRPLKHPFIYQHYGKKIGGGILLYGPPGCGKSLIAEAAAGEANVAFFHVKSSDLKGKYVGETEKNIANLFAEARKYQPSIIFFDEFELLGGERTTAGEYQKSAVAQLLTEMNGVGTKNDQILLIAATNEPWSIDLALKREGRFGQTVLVPHPDLESRKQIFSLALKDKPVSSDVVFEKLAALTDGYSGADITAIVNIAIDQAMQRYFATKYLQDLTLADLLFGIDQVKPRLKQWYSKANKIITERNEQEGYEELVGVAAVST